MAVGIWTGSDMISGLGRLLGGNGSVPVLAVFAAAMVTFVRFVGALGLTAGMRSSLPMVMLLLLLRFGG